MRFVKVGSPYIWLIRPLYIVVLFLSLLVIDCHAQDRDSLQTDAFQTRFKQLEFRHDNDFWLSTDLYYTTGSFITYRVQKKADSLENVTRQWNYALRHLIYTPSNIRTDETGSYDRPYAGLLALSAEQVTVVGDRLFFLELLMGVAGPSSGAEAFQGLFHEEGGIDTPPWTDQIADSFHSNLYVGMYQEWDLRAAPWAMKLAFSPSLAIGSLDIYLQSEVVCFIGKRARMKESIAFGQLGRLQSEFFGGIRAGYRYVAHNAMIEGNAFGDDSPLTFEAEENLFLLGLEAYWRKNRNDIKVSYNFNTRETANADSHAVIALSYARSF